jgi:hypothetical protein
MITKRVAVLALAVITASTVQAQSAQSPAPAKFWVSASPMVHLGQNSHYGVLGGALGLAASTQRWELRLSVAQYHNIGRAGCQDDCADGIESSRELAVLTRSLYRTDRTVWYWGPTFGWVSSRTITTSAVGITLGCDRAWGRRTVLRLEAHGLQALHGKDDVSLFGGSFYRPAVRQGVVSVGLGFLAPM